MSIRWVITLDVIFPAPSVLFEITLLPIDSRRGYAADKSENDPSISASDFAKYLLLFGKWAALYTESDS